MNLYPALQATMGSWKYYIAKMKMKEVANEISFAYDFYDDRTLSEAIQRDLKESRVRKEIATFLARRTDRFFSSLVVAAIGGSPKFYPVKITDAPEFAVFADQGVDDAFGVLTFSGEQTYYALDGQHRLKAIKSLLDSDDPLNRQCPEGFGEEQISVLIVIKREAEETDLAFLQSYRRLFSSLNRYAKATDADTNIIMDEDDAFAILTRRLISEHPFFKWTGKERDSARVKTKTKNLKEGESYFTSLQTLYAMNQTLMSSRRRATLGWGLTTLEKDVNVFKAFRPDEEYLDALYAELVVAWDALLQTLPVLREDPSGHRNHADAAEKDDHLLFWPIGQELLANLARRLLDEQSDDDLQTPSVEAARKVLSPLRLVQWNLHKAPWRYFMLTQQGGAWKMRSESRAEATKTAERLLRALLGVDKLDAGDWKKLELEWKESLIPAQTAEDASALWSEVQKLRQRITDAM